MTDTPPARRRPAAPPKPKGLGRGLEALLGADLPVAASPGTPAPVASLAVERLQPGRYQPRTRMDESALQELADSIRLHGVMQPILVRPLPDQRYEIVAGERRYRAAQLAGLDEVPVIVREVADEQALAMALIENIQREDLNPLEEAQAIRRLIDEFAYSHERAAEAILGSADGAVLLRALALYVERFAQPDGKVPVTFEIITLTGWAPHESQQKPLKPGSAKMRLADALGTVERSAGDKAG